MTDRPPADRSGEAVDDVIITAELYRRSTRPPDHAAENRLLVELAQAMAESPQTILQRLADAALQLCRAGSAGVSIEETDQQPLFRWCATAGAFAPYVGGTMPRDFSPCGTVLDRGAALLMADPARHFPAVADLDPPVREALLVPFYRGQTPVGTVWVVSHSDHQFEAEDHRLIKSLSLFAAAAARTMGLLGDVEQARGLAKEAGTRMEEAEGRLRLMIESATDYAIFSIDTDGKVATWNGGAERVFGWTEAEILGRDIAVLFTPEDREAGVPEAEQRIARKEGKAADERWHMRKDGSRFFASGMLTPIRDEKLHGYAKVCRDMTGRKRAEEALRKSEVRHRVLSDLATATQPLTDSEAIMVAAARLLAEHLDVDRCAYAEIEDESIYVITGEHTNEAPSIAGRWPVAAFGAEQQRMMLANEPYVVEDVDNDPRIAAEDLPAYRATQIRAVVCVPLHKDGRFTAAMAVHQKTPRQWTATEIRLVTEVVGRCWEALERARVTRSLRESEERYRTLFGSMDEGFCVIEVLFEGDIPVDYRFLEVNPAFEKHTGLRDAVGKRMLELAPALDPHWFEIYGKVACTGEPVRFVSEAKALGRWFDVYAFSLGQGNKIAVLFNDITARIRIEDDRERLVEQLREADHRKDEFIALLAHELRNPLAPIRNGLQVIRLSDDRDLRQGAQGIMERQLSHMVRLIDDLLDISRVNRNRMELRRERISLADVVASAVETARPAIDAEEHDLSVTLPATPVYVDADLTRLAQVFSNLLTNSAKYTPRGGRICLTAERRDGEVAVSVRDNGIGIPVEALPTIFDMFSQVDRGIERSAGGLGIGLALVKGLVEMHGGTVSASSRGEGHGSTFTITLPVLASDAAPETDLPISAATPGQARRILVVDDNRDGAESLALMLRLLGNDVRTANDGIEAVEQAEASRPEVILMDVGMPRLNGLDATRRIREQPWGKAITIIALTGWGQADDRQQSCEAGCDGHLVKPVSLADLENILAGEKTGGPG